MPSPRSSRAAHSSSDDAGGAGDDSQVDPATASDPALDFAGLLATWPNQNVLAQDLNLSHWTVRSWQRRNHVPERWHRDLLRSALTWGVPCSAELLRRLEDDFQAQWRDRAKRPDEAPSEATERDSSTPLKPSRRMLANGNAVVQDAQYDGAVDLSQFLLIGGLADA